jgi:hypothetical protein
VQEEELWEVIGGVPWQLAIDGISKECEDQNDAWR